MHRIFYCLYQTTFIKEVWRSSHTHCPRSRHYKLLLLQKICLQVGMEYYNRPHPLLPLRILRLVAFLLKSYIINQCNTKLCNCVVDCNFCSKPHSLNRRGVQATPTSPTLNIVFLRSNIVW